jgi:hypothetical protein
MDALRKTTALNLVLLATKRNEHECTLTVEICTSDKIDMDAPDASHIILLRFTSQVNTQGCGIVIKNGVIDDALITFCKKLGVGGFAESDSEIGVVVRPNGKNVLLKCFIRYFRGLFTIIPRNTTSREFIVSRGEMLKLVDVVLYNPPVLT